MPRVKRAKIHLKKRKTLKRAVKGYRWRRKNIIRLARPAMLKAGVYAFRDRRNKKRDFRRLWQIKINAAARDNDLTYSKLINLLKKNKIELDRKILADLAENQPVVFKRIVEEVKK